MVIVINGIARICEFIMTGILFPFQAVPPIYGLIVLSSLTGMFILFVFRFTSNREKLESIKGQIKADILKIWLFNHDIVIVLKTQWTLLLDNIRYIRLTFLSFLIMIIPVLMVLVVGSSWFEHRPLRPAETVLVTLTFRSGISPREMEVTPEFPGMLRVTAPPVYIESLRQISWRAQAVGVGRQSILWMINRNKVEQQVVISNKVEPVYPFSVRNTLRNSISYFTQPVLDTDGPIESIHIAYPERILSFLGWKIHWLIVFFMVSLLIVILLKNIFGVVV